MFQRINPDQLVVGNKYKIDNYTGYFKEKSTWDSLFYVFEKVKKDKQTIPVLHFSHNFKIHTFVSQNPQWQMERRAVNIIVRRLIGDQSFYW